MLEEEKKDVESRQAAAENEISDLIAEFQSRLNLIVTRASTPRRPQSMLVHKLKKLPMFGRSDNLEFKNYFEFPSEQEFELMPDKQSVRMKSISIFASSNGMNLGGFQVHLSDGVTSGIMGDYVDCFSCHEMQVDDFEVNAIQIEKVQGVNYPKGWRLVNHDGSKVKRVQPHLFG